MEAFLPYWLQRRRNKKMIRKVQKRTTLQDVELPLADQVRLEADMSTYLVSTSIRGYSFPTLQQRLKHLHHPACACLARSLRELSTTTWSSSCCSAMSVSSPASTRWLPSWSYSTTSQRFTRTLSRCVACSSGRSLNQWPTLESGR